MGGIATNFLDYSPGVVSKSYFAFQFSVFEAINCIYILYTHTPPCLLINLLVQDRLINCEFRCTLKATAPGLFPYFYPFAHLSGNWRRGLNECVEIVLNQRSVMIFF